MPKKLSFMIVLGILIAGGVLASLGDRNPDVSLSSVREIWADVLRDADQVGLKVTRVRPDEEMRLGDEMAASFRWAGDPDAERYVAAVAARLTPNVRRKEIRYTFHVVASPEINAFALPGGHIYVLRGLLDFLQNESELASILGHEISHVDLRHCIERYQYQVVLRKAGAGDVGMLAEIAHGLYAIGYTQFQELEADAQGERLAIQAGYDPQAGPDVFHRMQQEFGERNAAPANTPAGEVVGSIGQAIGSYFQTHPGSAARERQLQAMLPRDHREVYVGVRNYRERISRNERAYPEEQRIR